MNHLLLNVEFSDNVHPKENDSYTLCAKNNINPAGVLTYDIFNPINTDGFIWRSPQYNNHPTTIYGFGLPTITYPDNAWAWVYNFNHEYVQFPYPCFNDILALDHSNSIVALASLVRIIAQKKKLDALDDVMFGGMSNALPIVVTCKLPEAINLRAHFYCNNQLYSLHIFAQFSNGSTNILNFTIDANNSNAPQLVTPQINTCFNSNILDAISSIIHTTQLQHHVKIYFDTMKHGKLISQPVL